MLNLRSIAFAFALGISLFMTACTSLNRVSGNEFLIQAKHINKLESAKSTRYIGASEHNAYLEVWRAGVLDKKGSTTLVWTPIEELPADIAEKIKAGKNPWQTQQ